MLNTSDYLIPLKFFSLIIQIIFSNPTCKEGTNFCSKCHPVSKLCVKCEKDIYVPDEKGGCEYSHRCITGENQCIECNETH